ncbi:hypothetical protein [Bradyrhizobium sp.]|uniref:hypothetical protein n=1 Tax=Bradyrhizobium sp. TaxID=376 RepID=UPI001DAC9CA9|nr:hypothetical protein [Bradyrhizobium sp.]MBI5318300.1 hypothetical protein [Bradyrhizobium sp.]
MVADLSLSATPWLGPGVMKVIKGENGAEPQIRPTIFRGRGAREKKVLEPSADGEGFHLLPEGIHLNPRQAYTPSGQNFPVT